jgi:RsiW-degrading membrane proteinase PrsW (M82 family)
MRSRAFASALALVLALLPAAAFACPYCAARADTTHRTLFFIAAMCLLPFVVGGVALAVIRKMDSDSDSEPDA